VIVTASKSSPLSEWLTEEHASMLLPIPSQPMDAVEEATLLSHTGASPEHIKLLLGFAEAYRRTMTSDAVQKIRKLGTRSLLRIARRLATFPWDDDLYGILGRSLLVEFLPTTEKMSLDAILEECGITERTPLVSTNPFLFPFSF
jgi:von Willebrand factor A domain-containing protein 8